jgi:hypothetical protein
MASEWIKRIAVTLALLAGPAIFWYNSGHDDLKAFKSIAYPCLPMETATTDPADFIMVTGVRAPPTEYTMPDGTLVYPVFSHPNPAIVPLVNGKTLYFPAKFLDNFGIETPPLPPRNQPLNKAYRFELVRYLPEETKASLDSAIQGTKP